MLVLSERFVSFCVLLGLLVTGVFSGFQIDADPWEGQDMVPVLEPWTFLFSVQADERCLR